MLRRTACVLGITLGLALILSGVISRTTSDVHHTGPTIEQIQQLSQLVTLKVDVADVVETTVDGYTGGIRAVLVVKGDYLVSTDLTQTRFVSVDADAKSVVLSLALPRVLSPRIDHQRSRVAVLHERGLWQIVPGEGAEAKVLTDLHVVAQRLIAASSSDQAVVKRAKDRTEQVLKSWFEAIGWRVQIRWAGR